MQAKNLGWAQIMTGEYRMVDRDEHQYLVAWICPWECLIRMVVDIPSIETGSISWMARHVKQVRKEPVGSAP